ncbi:MAG TPA: DUF4129 domain-containing protein [Gaiellaceae bacterium]|nr:DUF4129 domain-containing protein [Gaiellaceae bacterium]
MSLRRLAVPVLALAAGLGAVVAPAVAADATLAEVRDLAERAGRDPAALAELRAIDSVDGRPVDLRSALVGEAADVAERLETLADSRAVGRVDARGAREDAADILAAGRYREPDTPRPFRGALEWLGERLEALYDGLAERLPGGGRTVWALLGALVVGAAALVSVRLVRRRGGYSVEGAARGGRGRRLDPAELERRADEAEERGELGEALRLRFGAGLLRLERARAIPFRESLTSGEIARRLGSAEFERLAGTFDEVVYGGRPAGPEDVQASREGWPRVLAEARAA